MDFKITPQSGNSYSHMWDVSSMKQFDGGFLFDKTCLPSGITKLPKGVFLSVDLVERKAKLVKTVEIHAAVSSTDTAVKIKKGHMLLTTDIIGNGSKSVTVGTIDTSDDDFDELTITANALGTLSAGAVLQTATAAGSSKAVVNPDGLNPFEVLIDANPLCDVMFKADGIVVSRLPQKINDTIKTALKFCQFT